MNLFRLSHHRLATRGRQEPTGELFDNNVPDYGVKPYKR
jgi:hypothetical protein